MKKQLFSICDWKTYVYTTVDGYAYHDTQLDLHCFLYRKSPLHSWGLYDCTTGLSLHATGETREQTIKAWEYVKESKNVTRELIKELQDAFIEKRNKTMTV